MIERIRAFFSHGVVALISGAILSQVIGISVYPIITRLYSPSTFGSFSLVSSILSVALVAVCLKYEQAIVLPADDAEAAIVLRLCDSLLLWLAPALGALGAFYNAFRSNDGLSNAFAEGVMLVVALLAQGYYQAHYLWFSRKGRFKRLAATQIIQVCVASALQCGLAFIPGASEIGLLLGYCGGQVAAAIHVRVGHSGESAVFVPTDPCALRAAAREHRAFPKFTLPSSLLNTISVMVPIFLLDYYFEKEVLGYYSLANKILFLPISLIGNAYAQTFYPKAAEAARGGDLRKLTIDTMESLVRLGFVPFCLLALIAPNAFSFVFGSEWRSAGEYARWLCPWLLLVFIASPVSQVYLVRDRQGLNLAMNLVFLVVRIASIVLGAALFDSAQMAIASFGALSLAVWALNLGMIVRLVGADVRGVARSFFGGLWPGALLLLLPAAALIARADDAILLTASGLCLSGYLILNRDAAPTRG